MDGESVFADLLLAEGNAGIYSPLMKWAGQVPDAIFYDAAGTRVLVVQKDSGGNVPMVQTWAWVWGPRGPVRLNVAAAMRAAFHSLGPDYSGYSTGIDWKTLHCLTNAWQGTYPGKVW